VGEEEDVFSAPAKPGGANLEGGVVRGCANGSDNIDDAAEDDGLPIGGEEGDEERGGLFEGLAVFCVTRMPLNGTALVKGADR